MKNFFEQTFLIVGSILIGIPFGFFVGLYCWLKVPLSVYREARINLAIKRIKEAKAFLEEHGQGQKSQDIWERHIQRIEEKKSYDN